MTVRKRRNTKKQTPKVKMNVAKLWRLVKVTVLSSIFLASLGIAGFYISVKANEFLNRPIDQLSIQGDLQYTNGQQLRTLILESTNKSFIKEHLANIQSIIEASPWVDTASLTRHWPNHLQVTIYEQAPIARWGEQGFVNNRGELVKTKSLEKIQHLPLLFGDEVEAEKLMQQYKILTPLLIKNELAIHALSKNNLGVWQLELSNGWELILGRNSLAEKVKLVNQVLDQKILLTSDTIKTIDMRYENGFAIAWDDSVMILDDQHENKSNLGEPS